NNLIYRHGTSKLARGSVFMIEVGSGSHADSTGTYVFGGQTYENNLFVDVHSPVMVLGKGGTRMRNITVRNNIFMNGYSDAAIRISSPHENLIIENNIFYNQNYAIEIPKYDDFVKSYRSLPSSISIRNNIFSNSKNVIDPDLLIPGEKSNLNINDNLFYQNGQSPVGDRSVIKNPGFRSPEQWDFRPQPPGSEKISYHYFGPYPADGSPSRGMDWWNLKNNRGY
ncbi:MAG TPA: right-handed parallel beta-helix repeat-containing protein, partial [Mariniphaga sp.]|nr:right-handed parallel beta-helix repeat-containing protein [Mariniphaga sp.]